KLDEVLALCDRVAVLRHGQLVGDRSTQAVTSGELAELMVGRTLSTLPQVAQNLDAAASCLEIKNLTYEKLNNFSLSIRRGEIVGVAGVDGNGQAELVEALAGLHPVKSGTVLVNGENIDRQNSPI